MSRDDSLYHLKRLYIIALFTILPVSIIVSMLLLNCVAVIVIEHVCGLNLLGTSIRAAPYITFLVACFNAILFALFFYTYINKTVAKVSLGLFNASSMIALIKGFPYIINNPLLIVLMILMSVFNIILSILIIKVPDFVILFFIERYLERYIKHINDYETSKNEHI
ncbi:MAG: hypothetical protein QXX82_03770 [Nitrososphaerota archaeon]